MAFTKTPIFPAITIREMPPVEDTIELGPNNNPIWAEPMAESEQERAARTANERNREVQLAALGLSHPANVQTVRPDSVTIMGKLDAGEKAYRKHIRRIMRKRPEHKEKEQARDQERRAEPAYKTRAVTNTKAFREDNPGYHLADGRKRDGMDYHRPFCVIDSEGCTIPGSPTVKGGVSYPPHGSFLSGAGYWQRRLPGTGIGPATGQAQSTSFTRSIGSNELGHSGTDGADGKFDWLKSRDKSPLTTHQMFFWLTEYRNK